MPEKTFSVGVTKLIGRIGGPKPGIALCVNDNSNLLIPLGDDAEKHRDEILEFFKYNIVTVMVNRTGLQVGDIQLKGRFRVMNLGQMEDDFEVMISHPTNTKEQYYVYAKYCSELALEYRSEPKSIQGIYRIPDLEVKRDTNLEPPTVDSFDHAVLAVHENSKLCGTATEARKEDNMHGTIGEGESVKKFVGSVPFIPTPTPKRSTPDEYIHEAPSDNSEFWKIANMSTMQFLEMIHTRLEGKPGLSDVKRDIDTFLSVMKLQDASGSIQSNIGLIVAVVEGSPNSGVREYAKTFLKHIRTLV